VAFILSWKLLTYLAALEVTLAIFCGQCVVGWTNDLVDRENDHRAGRHHKPLAFGELSVKSVEILIPIMAIVALVISLLSPLHLLGTLLHALGLLSATLYNLWLKRTLASFVPYLISFSLLPVAIYSTVNKFAPLWLVVAFATTACSFHFLNVIKDLEEDRNQGLFGLPQRVGRKGSQLIALLLALAAVLDVMVWR
jgi:4-hydroxybenzoate polyprenyltransferase